MNLPAFLTRDPDGFLRPPEGRIGLQHVAYWRREYFWSAEMLFCRFPMLSLDWIHKALAFYEENKAEVDAYVAPFEAELRQQEEAYRRDMARVRQRLKEINQEELSPNPERDSPPRLP